MGPVAEYSEKTFRTKKTFTLFSDRIRIAGKVSLEQDFTIEVKLKDVTPAYEEIWQRDKTFWAGLAMAGLSAIVLQILRDVLGLSWSHFTPGLMSVFVVSGLLLCCVTARKVEFYTFRNTSGVPLFSVARAGKSKSEFDQFISTIVATINSVHQNTKPRAEPDGAEEPVSG